eukprot:TRINITY_DN6593_c0_g1_i2.p1 TRINITY_DN6593_c0_g1~~TRINITY_DN6593_c0_g1_i2.p1  ORF type:complete len:133 (+),score=32.70 TRINITY_DN6593_c0_g1_i2:345-743(+)
MHTNFMVAVVYYMISKDEHNSRFLTEECVKGLVEYLDDFTRISSEKATPSSSSSGTKRKKYSANTHDKFITKMEEILADEENGVLSGNVSDISIMNISTIAVKTFSSSEHFKEILVKDGHIVDTQWISHEGF